ncbi:CDP-alcohol phosphatidyltransferase family protein [Candidatus Woesearchaeota archaeon]|nr:CDP-alcohol phosphatidyltransferase family protein [Candidatus Woesearchaeota archaeon]
MLGLYLREKTEKISSFFAQGLIKLRISPNMLTISSIFLALGAAYFLSKQRFGWGLLFVILASFWDVLDGSLARSSGKVTKFGNYLDAMIDRWVEVLFYFGLALAGFKIEAFLVATGSVIHSYAKARLALVIPTTNREWPAIGDRTDRLVLLIILLVIRSIIPSNALFSKLLFAQATIIGIGIIQRMIYAHQVIKEKRSE